MLTEVIQKQEIDIILLQEVTPIADNTNVVINKRDTAMLPERQ